MQPQDPNWENLHQEASAAYLQGEFEQALDVWRELLQMNPADERAMEGVRLCELLTQEEAATTVPSGGESKGSSAIAPPGSFSAAAEGFDDDLEELEEVLESGGDAAEEAEGFSFDFTNLPDQAGEAKPATEVPTPDRQGDGIDFGDISETETLAVDGEPPQEMEIESHSHAVDQPAGETADSTEAAAAELRSRVNELLAEALTNYEQGRKEEALGILNRLFILDESNSAALALHDNICAELDAAQGVIDTPAAPDEEAIDQDEEFEDLEALDLEPTVAPEMAPADPPPADELVADDGLDSSGDLCGDFTSDDLPAGPTIAEASETRRRGGGKLSLTRQNLIIIVALIAVLGTGGGLGYFFLLGGGGSGDSNTAQADGGVAVAGGGGPGLPVPGGRNGGDSTQTRGDGAADPLPARSAAAQAAPIDANSLARVEELLGSARSAMDSEDYAGAVLSLKAVLDLDPSNIEALDRLAEAGELYRAQKEIDDKRRRAIDAFNAGSYRSALTIFYRLPDSEDQETLNRYKRNGWYNMGLQALQAGDCNSATTHFKEAASVDGDDHEIVLAVDLAKSCRLSRSNEAFYDEVRQLPFRGLDD